MAKPEARFQGRFLKKLRNLPEGVFTKIMRSSDNGVSDIVGCYRGWFCAFEIKAEGGKLSSLQKEFIERIRLAGGHARVVFPGDESEVIEDLSRLGWRDLA